MVARSSGDLPKLEKVRVLHLMESPIRGGAARASQRIHEALLGRDDVVSCAGFFESSDSSSDANGALHIDAQPQFFKDKLFNRIAFTFRHYLSENVREFSDYLFLRDRRLENTVEALGPDFVFVHWLKARRLGLRSIARLKPRLVLVLHDLRLILGIRSYPARGWSRDLSEQFTLAERLAASLIRATLPKNVVVIAPSKWIGDATKVLGWDANSVLTIPYPIDTDFWKPITGQKSDGPRRNILFGFGYSGRGASRRKGEDLVLDSLPLLEEHLARANTKIELMLFGDATGPLVQSRYVKTKALGHLNDIELRLLYSRLDYLIVPSRVENLAQVAIEAQSCGLPCLVMNETGLTSAVTPSSSILIREPIPQAVAEAILEAIMTIDEMGAQSYASRNGATNSYSPARVSSLYMDLLYS